MATSHVLCTVERAATSESHTEETQKVNLMTTRRKKSTKKTGPGLFSTFGIKSKDLQTKDDLLDHRFSVATKTFTGVILRSTATNRKGVSTGDVGALYKSKNTSIGVKFDTQSNITMIIALKKTVPSANITASFKLHDLKSSKIATTLTLTKIIPSTKVTASFQLPDFRTGKFVVEYLHHHATLASTIVLNQAPTIDVSATIGTSMFAMGALAAYETSSSKFTNFIVGINVNVPNATASIILGDKGDMIRGTYMHHFDVSKRTAAAFEITRRLSTNKTNFLIGGSYVFDGRTVVKGKLNSWGKLGVVLQHEIIPKSRVSFSSELNIKALHKTPKFGLALVLKP